MLALTLISTVLTATAYALPSLQGRQSSNPCAGVGGLSVTDNASNFTLAALNTTLSNSNSSGAPLLLAGTTTGNVPQTAFLATYASYPADNLPGPEFSLQYGALVPQQGNDLVAYDLSVSAGSGLGWQVIYPNDLQKIGAEIYCIQDDGAPSGLQHGVLAVNGDTSDFSLCTTTSTPSLNQVIWKATEDNDDQYDYNSCYAVRLQIIY